MFSKRSVETRRLIMISTCPKYTIFPLFWLSLSYFRPFTSNGFSRNNEAYTSSIIPWKKDNLSVYNIIIIDYFASLLSFLKNWGKANMSEQRLLNDAWRSARLRFAKPIVMMWLQYLDHVSRQSRSSLQ